MTTARDLLDILDFGFTADNLQSLSDAGANAAPPTSSGALMLACYASAVIADRWERQVGTTHADDIREAFEAPIRSVLEALDSGSRDDCWLAADHLADQLASFSL